MFYILYPILYLISLLPLKILYFISDIARWIVFNIFQYRIEIIKDNINKAFPEKSEEERVTIRRNFQESFCDQWVETIKSFSTSASFVNKHVTGDWSLLHEYNKKYTNCYIMMGHQFNWEWASNAAQTSLEQRTAGIYLPLNNKTIDKLILKLRRRFDADLVSAKQFKDDLKEISQDIYILGLLCDQSPGKNSSMRWYNFLNRPTAFITGPAKGALARDVAVVFATVKKVKRGYYKFTLEEICKQARQHTIEYITDQYVLKLEKSIREQPENWLWSHRRWKLDPDENTDIVELKKKQ